MRLLALCAIPLVTALVVLAAPAFRGRRVPVALLLVVAAAHLALVTSLWVTPAPPALGGWLAADPLGLTVLTLTSVLFLVTGIYVVGYLRRDAPRSGRVFAGGLLAFLAAASVVALAHHLHQRLAPGGQHDESDDERRERHRHEQWLLHPGQRQA